MSQSERPLPVVEPYRTCTSMRSFPGRAPKRIVVLKVAEEAAGLYERRTLSHRRVSKPNPIGAWQYPMFCRFQSGRSLPDGEIR